ncbi:MAG: hypothetical protein ABI318_05620 [Chthoniobacteraceae bacterium]
MSDQPTDIVFNALKQMQANGVRMRASLDTCEQLRAATPAPQAAPRTTARDDAPPRIAQPGRRDETSTAPRISLPETTERPRPQPAPTLAASTPGGKAAKLDALRGPVLACTKCPHLVQSRTQVVFGVGNPEAELMFVG